MAGVLTFCIELAATREKQEFQLPSATTVAELRSAAAEFAGVNVSQVTLIFDKNPLSNESATLGESHIEDGTTVWVIQSVLEFDDDSETGTEADTATAAAESSAAVSSGVAHDIPALSEVTSMDLCILIDATSNMGKRVEQLREDISKVVHQIKRDYRSQISPLRLALVAYRDFDDSSDAPPRIEVFDFDTEATATVDAFERTLGALQCRGGVDMCEDVLGGLHACATRLKWRSAVRVLYHICDAPGHGSRFHDLYQYAADDDADDDDLDSQSSDYCLSDTDSESSEHKSATGSPVLSRAMIDRFPDGHSEDPQLEELLASLSASGCQLSCFAVAKPNEYVSKMLAVFADVCEHFGVNMVTLDIPNLCTLMPTLLSAVQSGIRLVASGKALSTALPFAKSSRKFRIDVGIDFGTSGCGIAYALGSELSTEKWPDAASDKKTGTHILLAVDGSAEDGVRFVAFGNDARIRYEKLDLGTADDSDDDSSDSEAVTHASGVEDLAKEYLYFEKFKMALYSSDGGEEAEDAKSDEAAVASQRVDIDTTIAAANGVRLPSAVVLKHALRFIGGRALAGARRLLKDETLTTADIQWVLTVPAIWSARAKAAMQSAAIAAGIVRPSVVRHLVIAYEPDCASLHVASQLSAKLREKGLDDTHHPYKAGAKYLLLDLGGGTADIACHEVVSARNVKEIHVPSGGPFGSTQIDAAFERWLRQVFADEWLDEFQRECNQEWVTLLHNFSVAKERFGQKRGKSKAHASGESKPKPKATKYHSFELGLEFVNFVDSKLSEATHSGHLRGCKSLADVCTAYAFSNKGKTTADAIRLKDSSLQMCYALWKWLFDGVVTGIVSLCVSLLTEKPETTRDFKFFVMVGGLSESEYVRHRIHAAIGRKSQFGLALLPSHDASLAVVKGAALIGRNPEYILCRTMAKTYGIAVQQPVADFLEGVAAKKHGILRAEQIPSHLLSATEPPTVCQVFWPIVRIGDVVRADESSKVFQFAPAASSGKVTVKLFQSCLAEPLWARPSDCVAKKTFAVSTALGAHSTFPIAFFFGETTIQVYVDLPHLPMESRMIRLNYDLK